VHWAEQRAGPSAQKVAQDNESWAYLLSLLAAIQQRVGALSQDRATIQASVQARALLGELEHEVQNLRGISQDIEKLQWRLRRSLHERDSGSIRAQLGNRTS